MSEANWRDCPSEGYCDVAGGNLEANVEEDDEEEANCADEDDDDDAEGAEAIEGVERTGTASTVSMNDTE